MSTLMIIEPNWMGHNMLYAAWTAGEAIDIGYDVSLATHSSFLAHPFYRELKNEYIGSFRPRALPDVTAPSHPGIAGYKFRYHRMFSRLRENLGDSEQPSGFFLPYMDYCTHASGLVGSPFGDVAWGGITINPDFHLRPAGISAPRSLSQRIKEALFFRMLNSRELKVVFALDELLINYARRKDAKLAEKISYIPEPASLGTLPDKCAARKRLGIPSSLKVVLVYGVVDYTKGLDALLSALTTERTPQDLAVLVAGPQSVEIQKLLLTSGARRLRDEGRLYELDEFLYGEMESTVFAASDIVWVGYRDQYISSGVLIQAGMANLPVIACNEGLIGYLTGSKRLGLTTDIRNTDAVVSSLLRMTREPDFAAECAANGNLYASDHSVESFKESLGQGLARHFPLG